MKTFTPKQMADWKAFERVRKGGRWNMYNPRARRDTGLGSEQYSFVVQNYAELKAAVEAESASTEKDT